MTKSNTQDKKQNQNNPKVERPLIDRSKSGTTKSNKEMKKKDTYAKELVRLYRQFEKEFYKDRSKMPYPYECQNPSFERFIYWLENGETDFIRQRKQLEI